MYLNDKGVKLLSQNFSIRQYQRPQKYEENNSFVYTCKYIYLNDLRKKKLFHMNLFF